MFASVVVRRLVLSAAAILVSYSVATVTLEIEVFPAERPKLARATSVVFNAKPNIYFMGLDALSPESVAKRFLNVEEVSYADVLRRNDFRIFKNAFADRTGTENFYNSLLVLDVPEFDRLPAKEKTKFFSGTRPGILFETFRSNGYKVQTLYRNTKFGEKNGPFVDFYGVSQLRDVCTNILVFSDEFSFMGLCHEKLKSVLSRINGTYGLKRGGWDPDWDNFLDERMLMAATARQPWVTMAHTLAPAHVKIGYNHDIEEHRLEYRETFIKREKIAAKLIEKWVDFIQREDPGAVLIVYGDHGSYLTTATQYVNVASDDERRFFVVDRHAITLAVWPKMKCGESFDRENEKGYVTMSQFARSLIKCLAGGADPVSRKTSDTLPYENLRYEDYRYE